MSFSSEISPELHLELSKLCIELQLFFNKTQSSFLFAKQNFKQAENVMKPWEISNNNSSGQFKCLCSTLSNIHISENNEETALLNSISKTLTNAELARKKSLKTDIPLKKVTSKSNSNDKNLQKSIINKPNKCSSVGNTSANNFEHSPCCPLFERNEELVPMKSLLNISEALHFYKIPSVLSNTVKYSNKMLRTSGKSENLKSNYKDIYFQSLETQFGDYNQEKETFYTYLSALNSYEKKPKNMNYDSWLFYKDGKSLKKYQTSRLHFISKESWLRILKLITNEIIPVLQEDELDSNQKLYLFKMLKTICNFVYSTVPSVPIFRIEIND